MSRTAIGGNVVKIIFHNNRYFIRFFARVMSNRRETGVIFNENVTPYLSWENTGCIGNFHFFYTLDDGIC